MMDDLILHETTRTQLDNFVARPSHAVLLFGPNGIGKRTTAQALVASLLGLQDAHLAAYPYYLHMTPDGASISIDAIRQLQKFLLLKTTGEQPLRRAVIIEDAGVLTVEAQNAFLKLLEEPPADTVMVLTASTPRAFLPTILSRLQTIPITAPDPAQLQPLLDASKKDEAARKQAYFLSGGLPGLLTALLDDTQEHPLLASVTQAKELLVKTPFERLAIADTISKQKGAALGVVEALERIAQTGLYGAGAKQATPQIKRWHRVRKSALEARQALEKSANAKLTLSNLFLQL